ncbi:MAG TPA: polysaccharide biosynthesis protein, partial [Polyangiales bacterium]|nr:polysaccharide biosynthesis protein [Polyangiales bacterium]
MIGDFACMPLLFWAALALRYDTFSPPVLPGMPFGLTIVAVLTVATFFFAGVYRAVVRAFDERFLQQLLIGIGVNVALLSLLASTGDVKLPRSVPPIYSSFAFLWVWASRSAIRHGVYVLTRSRIVSRRVAIYGAGAAGRQTLAALRLTSEYVPVAFFDDGPQLVGTMLQGVKVYRGADFQRVAASLQIEEVLLALPSVSRSRRRAVIELIEPANIRIRTLPGISQLVDGRVTMADLQDVDVADLLSRDPVPPSQELTSRDTRSKHVMVTGGGGSIGAELCRQVLKEEPALLVIVELNEYALYSIDHELRALYTDTQIVSVLGSVLDEDRMARLMSQHRIDSVYHAAAYKHVPLVESNPFEGLINNSIGTLRAARAALQANVTSFVLVSTDKAVRPTNVMGASKRLAELTLQALAAESSCRTRFSMVRFGNVLNSSGSVIPL